MQMSSSVDDGPSTLRRHRNTLTIQRGMNYHSVKDSFSADIYIKLKFQTTAASVVKLNSFSFEKCFDDAALG